MLIIVDETSEPQSHRLLVQPGLMMDFPLSVHHILRRMEGAHGAKKVVTLVRDANVPLLGAVENMSSFVCPDCGSRHDVFPPVARERSLWADGIERLARIPLDPSLSRTNGVTPAFTALAEKLARRLEA